jgi:hypothetical protein
VTKVLKFKFAAEDCGAMEKSKGRPRGVLLPALLGVFIVASAAQPAETAYGPLKGTQKTNAYATMMYMGTPRDYEFYVAMRVMLGTLVRLQVDADLVVIASATVPQHWQQTLYEPQSPCSQNLLILNPLIFP